MNTSIRTLFFSLSLVFATAFVASAMPMLNVTVADAKGNVAYKGKTSANGTFATGKLAPGNYVVQFNGAGVPAGNYALVISAGKQKVMAEAVSNQKFGKGGVAMRLNVGKDMNITGQLSSGKAASGNMSSDAKIKIVNGKKYHWVGPTTGSNMGGRWEEEGAASSQNVQSVDSGSVMDAAGRH